MPTEAVIAHVVVSKFHSQAIARPDRLANFQEVEARKHDDRPQLGCSGGNFSSSCSTDGRLEKLSPWSRMI